MKLFSACAGLLAVSAASAALVGCETDAPTTVVVENRFPATEDSPGPSGYRLWYEETLFLDVVAPGQASEAERAVPGSDFAYAVLTVGWNPSSPSKPTNVIPIRSRKKFSVARGETLTIPVSDGSFTGRCDAAEPLSQDDAGFVTERIFPGEFADVRLDAATCMSEPLAGGDGRLTTDAGSD